MNKLIIKDNDQAVAIACVINTLKEGMELDMALYQEYGAKKLKKAIRQMHKLEKRIAKSGGREIRLSKQDRIILVRACEDDQDRACMGDTFHEEWFSKYIEPVLTVLEGGV